ncbi:MAG TPA: hypothetical protein VLL52_21520 [Anaerolineae bacterium]|nr:hypothetical protein [Anaerolineae bacterium]
MLHHLNLSFSYTPSPQQQHLYTLPQNPPTFNPSPQLNDTPIYPPPTFGH